MNKLERIARKVVAFKQTIHVNENGIEIPVEETCSEEIN